MATFNVEFNPVHYLSGEKIRQCKQECNRYKSEALCLWRREMKSVQTFINAEVVQCVYLGNKLGNQSQSPVSHRDIIHRWYPDDTTDKPSQATMIHRAFGKMVKYDRINYHCVVGTYMCPLRNLTSKSRKHQQMT